jgi:hypothetical protein
MFFAATAPLDAGGHVNLSPKGLDTLRILGPTTVAYLGHVGSGSETITHPKENGGHLISRSTNVWVSFAKTRARSKIVTASSLTCTSDLFS